MVSDVINLLVIPFFATACISIIAVMIENRKKRHRVLKIRINDVSAQVREVFDHNHRYCDILCLMNLDDKTDFLEKYDVFLLKD